VSTNYRNPQGYRNAATYSTSVSLGALVPMYEGSSVATDLYAVDLQYQAPLTEYLIFDWQQIGAQNPVYVADPTDYFVVDFTPHQGPQAIGQVLIYDGSSFDANQHLTDLGTIVLGYGSTTTFNLKTTIIAYMQSTFLEGSGLVSNLATTAVLTGDGNLESYTGDELDFNLAIHPAVPITPDAFLFYEGSKLDFNLAISQGLVTQINDGSQFNIIGLVTCEGCNSSSVTFDDGAELVSNLAVTQTLDTKMYEGSGLTTVFSIYPAWREATPVFYDGSTVSSNLATDVDLTGDGASVVYDGTALLFNLTQNLPWRPTLIAYEGSGSILLGLATKSTITNRFWSGEQLDTTLTLNPQYQPGSVFSDGATMVLPTIAARQSLPQLVVYEGSTLQPFALDALSNWYIYEGSHAVVNLATQVVFTGDHNLTFNQGETFNSSLNVSPALPLSNDWRVYTGESLNATMQIRPSVQLAVVFAQDMYLQFDFSTSTHSIDLARQCAVAQADNTFYWKDPLVHWTNVTNHGVQTQPGALATGFNTYMNLTLAVKATLSPKPMYSGESFGVINFWPLLSSIGSMGFGMTVLDLKFDLDIPLCLGNFIPDGAEVNAELSALDDTSCSVDQAFDGSTMNVELFKLHMREATTWYQGEQAYSDLTTVPGWHVTFWDGSGMFVASNAEMQMQLAHGEFFTVEFKPWTIVFSDGASFHAPSVNTDYFVQFIEVGCLQNEYTPTTIINFDPFKAPSIANIELQPFFHQIQAECF
jgi:hypothetical protein